jgi:phosphate/sulfate permease
VVGVTAMLVIVVLMAVAFDYINGFHDTANAIAKSVATRALSPRLAILMAASFNFIGAFAGTAVAKTIGSGLVEESTTTQAIIVAALLGAITWNLITWWLSLPSSRSHALIGGLLGATFVSSGTGAFKVDGIVGKVLVPMITSPLLGFTIAFALMLAAGLKGIEEGYELPPEAENNVWELTDAERRALGYNALPASLDHALSLMEDSELVAETLGEQVFNYVLLNKRREWEAYRAQVTPFELESNLEIL